MLSSRSTATIRSRIGIIVATLAAMSVLPAATGAAAPPASRLLPAAPASTPLAASSSSPTYTLPPTPTPGRYIVMLKRAPLASYTGGTQGIPATKPAPHGTLEVDSEAAQQYDRVLRNDQQVIADSVGVTPAARYTVVLNGFTADLTSSQARQLAATPGVLAIAKDTVRHTEGAPSVAAGDGAPPICRRRRRWSRICRRRRRAKLGGLPRAHRNRRRVGIRRRRGERRQGCGDRRDRHRHLAGESVIRGLSAH